MCGIYGLVVNNTNRFTPRRFGSALRSLIQLSQPRGCEAAGLAIASKNKISIYKQPMKPSLMLKTKSFPQFLERSAFQSGREGIRALNIPIALVGHTRLVTNGSQILAENNQPIRKSHFVGVHNGIITNDQLLIGRNNGAIGLETTSDSDIFYEILNRYFEEEKSLPRALTKLYHQIAGSASVAFLCDALSSLALATNTGSLYHYSSRREKFFVFSSEHFFVERFLKKLRVKPEEGEKIQQLKPATGLIVSLDTLTEEPVALDGDLRSSNGSSNGSLRRLYEIVDESVKTKSLRRCTRCVLPHTYPFISFDAEGVCNYCRHFKKQEFLGREALEEILKQYRSKDGKPDCIVGFSGGRDSSYGLHMLKTEFNMNPIAYTYDWGMVTDRSRRNQAKIVGKLGIEHIIRAADIPTKRRYIRKNIYAWLKKPHLGMVPLFMAGDKGFYYYGRKLRQETGIRLTIFSAGHQVEQMEFKAGFCGVNQQLTNNTKLYHFGLWNKIRLAAFYASQYLTNPSYINESVLDSLFSFYASFLGKDDYLYLYYYIPWDEKVIEKLLAEEYGWEADEKFGKNQWRMGDGHTAFTNYIWTAVAGFSEFDTFRSNQIREGMLTREEALTLVEGDNKPRLEVLKEFSQLVGINLEEVLLKINSIPKLYERSPENFV